MTDIGAVTWQQPRRDNARLVAKRFPVLATQVRCSTGFTHAPEGVLRMPGQVARVEPPAKVVVPEGKWAPLEAVKPGSFAAQLRDVLFLLADRRAALPVPKALLEMTGVTGSAGYLVAKGLDELERCGHLRHVRPPKGIAAGRMVTLRDGRVLRSLPVRRHDG